MSKKDALAKGFAVVTKLPGKPQRTAVSETAAQAFEAAGQREPTKPKASSLRRGVGGARVAVYLPAELEQGLRVRCATDRRSISDAVTEAVAKWLEG